MRSFLLIILTTVFVIRAEKPQQIHLSLTKNAMEMQVTWITMTNESVARQRVEYRKSATSRMTYINAITTEFNEKKDSIRFVHRAVMTNLNPGDQYVYQVGIPSDLSPEFVFTHPAANPPYRICIFGDLGVENGMSMPQLLKEAEKRSFDLIIHIGDIAYDLFKHQGTVGDEFLNTLQPLLATVPYMVIPGNHEEEEGKNFTTFKNLFSMPDYEIGENSFYSFNLGPVHFVALSSEYYAYHNDYGTGPGLKQYEWLQNDLQSAVSNRNSQPWIIAYHHRPFYCSNHNSDKCTVYEDNLIREGGDGLPGWEALYNSSKVDLVFSGHEHSYERFYPRQAGIENSPNPYHNSPTPVYIVSGAAGCHSDHSRFSKNAADFSAAKSLDYGFSRLTVVNRTHIHLEQYSVDQNKIIDEAWFSKDV